MSNFWGAVHDDLPLFTDRISAALSYNAVPAAVSYTHLTLPTKLEV